VHVIYTSDHGYQMGAHRLDGKGAWMYEEACRIPMVWRTPEGQTESVKNDTPVNLVDIAPTMLDMAGIDIPERLDGTSMRNLIEKPQTTEDRAVEIEFNRFGLLGGFFAPIRCIVRGHWKLAVNLLTDDELYNLNDDPHEMQNRINDPSCAEMRDRLHDELLDRMEKRMDPFRGNEWFERTWRKTPRNSTTKKADGQRLLDDGFSPGQWDYKSGELFE